MVPLSAIAKFEQQRTALQVNHQGQYPAVTLSFNLAPNFALGDAVTALEKAQREMGMPSSIHPTFQGTAQAFQDSKNNMPWLILAALTAVYIVLGILYESLIHPLTILSTIPPAGVGAILALMLMGTELEHHRADRHHPADRHREKERHHDDRLRSAGRARRGIAAH